METDSQNPALQVREIPPAPPPPPRLLNDHARRSLLIEPRVLRWWYMVGLTLILFSAFCADRLWERHTEMLLIRDGLVVRAKILGAENKQNNQPFTSGDACSLLFQFPTGTEQQDAVYLSNGGMTGSTITLHVDPADHSRWTDRSEATPLLDSLFVGLMTLPVAPLLIVVGVIQLKRLRRLWRSGSAALAVVFDRRQSAIAPTTFVVRCTMHDQRNRELFSVHVPRIGVGLQKGDVIWVIAGTKNEQPLAALWMPPALVAVPVAASPPPPPPPPRGQLP